MVRDFDQNAHLLEHFHLQDAFLTFLKQCVCLGCETIRFHDNLENNNVVNGTFCLDRLELVVLLVATKPESVLAFIDIEQHDSVLVTQKHQYCTQES